MSFSSTIAQQLQLQERNVTQTLQLLSEGATIPFIARYRKEVTGNLDEVQIEDIDKLAKLLEAFQQRKEYILKSIEEKGKLTDELRQEIENCTEETTLEDLYLPYKSKRKTRADKAKEQGLEPLAKMLISQNSDHIFNNLDRFTQNLSEDEALAGARDIIAEWLNERQFLRNKVRFAFERYATIKSKVVGTKKEEAQQFSDYFDFEEPLKRCPSHRLLAIRRGEQEGFLRVSIQPDEERTLQELNRVVLKNRSECASQVELAVKDAYKRLLKPSIENEFAKASKEKADQSAIDVFAKNLRQLLMMAPLGSQRILAIDPGFRTGCKLVCLDESGNLKHNENIYPHPPHNQKGKAQAKIAQLVNSFKIDAIAIGNGTASRETEEVVRKTRFDRDLNVFIVNEAGASIYSASKIAREEFPNYDVTVRGAVSIGRRLMDPLAELVKIEPKSIGVGQYQHDVDQKLLKERLDSVVVSCVNAVGIDVNTASKHLLTYVSGVGPQIAQNIVDFRKENGQFTSRQQLLSVPKLGKKAFEQAAGFLRVVNAENPLDNSAVHPERYALVKKMTSHLNSTIAELIGNEKLVTQIDAKEYVSSSVGIPTIEDIKKELLKPGRDPRKQIKVFEFAKGVSKVSDLQEGMELPGIVTNITNFGAFVDVGVKQDGLVHISEMAHQFVSNPADVVTLGQHVKVKVLSIDSQRNRIAFTMKL